MSAYSVCLGYLAEEVDELGEFPAPHSESYVGGVPSWNGQEPAQESLTCKECESILSQVAQVFAPLGTVKQRSIHILFCFACFSEESWSVLRTQAEVLAEAVNEGISACQAISEHTPLFGTSDDWREDDREDWSEINDIDGDDAEEEMIEALLKLEVTEPAVEEKNKETACNPLVPKLVQSRIQTNVAIRPCWISFEQEDGSPTEISREETSRANELWETYRSENTSTSRLDGEWANESYEAPLPIEKELKFQNQLAENPEQILRYGLGTRPLLPRKRLPREVPTCVNCGKKLMNCGPDLSPLCQSEKNEANTGSREFDFGTILVFSCPDSCRKEGKLWCEESVMYLPPLG